MNLADIAEIAGVSVATVGRALSGKGRVAPTTKKKIQAIATKLEYEPFAPGRALVTGRRSTIGVVSQGMYDFGEEWTMRMLGGAAKALEAVDYHTMVFYSEPREPKIPPMVLRRAVDGIIVLSAWSVGFLAELKRHDMPCVVACPGKEVGVDCDTVWADDLAGTRMSTEHLLDLGHREIAYVGTHTPGVTTLNRMRWEGYAAAMSGAGLPLIGAESRTAPPLVQLEQVLAQASPTALVCFSDHVAIAAMQELGDRNLKVPRDLSVVGVDDMSYLQFVRPYLTTVRVPFNEMGEVAAGLILQRLDAPERAPEHAVLPEKLIIRDSTAPPRR